MHSKMKFRFPAYLARLLTVGLALCTTIYATDVSSLTESTFDDFVGKEPLVVVKFFAPWCAHCKEMAPEFEKAATQLKGKAVFADVDVTVEENLAERFDVAGFPSIKLFSSGEMLANYNGARDTDSMVKYVESAMLPAFETFSDAGEFETFVKDAKDQSILVGVNLDESGKKELTKASFAVRDYFPDTVMFAAVKDAEVVSLVADIAESGYVLLWKEKGNIIALDYDGAEGQKLDQFVTSNSLPVFGEFTADSADLYSEAGKPVVFGFFPTALEEEAQLDRNLLEEMAKKKRGNGKVLFAWVDVDTLSAFAEYLGFAEDEVHVAAWDLTTDVKYKLPPGTKKLTEDILEEWVDSLIAGTAKAELRSEPVPVTQPETGAYVVVGDSFKEVVVDSDLDVMIAQVAPWCGHCKAMKPTYNRVADELRSASIDTVRIALMDATENNAPSEYQAAGFPYMHFFPAGKPGIEYDGDRSSVAIIDFIKEHATYKFDFDTSKLGEDPPPEEDSEDADMDEFMEYDGEDTEGDLHMPEDEDEEAETEEITGGDAGRNLNMREGGHEMDVRDEL